MRIPFGQTDASPAFLLISDGQTPPPPAAVPLERTRVRGVEMTTMGSAEFAMTRLGGVELGGSPTDVRAAIQRARPRGKGRRDVPASPLTQGVRETISIIGPSQDFWWLIYWGDSAGTSAGGTQGIAVTARLAGRSDLLTIEVLWFYPDDEAATASEKGDAPDYRKGLRSIHVDAGAESFAITQRGRVVVYSLTAPPAEVVSYRKLLHRMWDAMQQGLI